MAKTIYTCIIFFENRQPVKYRGVTNPYNLWKYCERLGRPTAMNLYLKDSKQFAKQCRTLSDVYQFLNSY